MPKPWLDVLTDCAKAQQDMHAANQDVEQAERSYKDAQKVAQKARDQYEKSRLALMAAAEDQVSQISGIPRAPQMGVTVQQRKIWQDAMSDAVRDSSAVLGAQVDPQYIPSTGVVVSDRIWSGSLSET
jgi:hypothetical protein